MTRLRYTPRRLAIHPEHNTLFVAEADHGAIPLGAREDLKSRMQEGEGGVLEVRASILRWCTLFWKGLWLRCLNLQVLTWRLGRRVCWR